MSKFPDLFFPALGGTVLVMGVAFAMASRDYGAERIEGLERRVAQVEETANSAGVRAEAEATRAAELQLKIEEVQARAQERSAMSVNLTAPAPKHDGSFGLGRAALTEEIAAWDVDVLPDGRGLPEGSGDVFTGEEVFAEKCASCHGDFAEGVDNWPVLAGGFDTLADEDPVKTVGSYWPHLSTAWDYIHRSMPFGEAGTLTADETYAIVAYILYSNDLVDDEFVLTHENLASFEMHNREGFVVDDRATLEYAPWSVEPCMTNCKDEAKVTMRSVFLVETPAEGGSNSIMNHARDQEPPSFTNGGASFIPAVSEAPKEEAKVTPAANTSSEDLIADGKKVFRKCKSCHEVGEGAKNKSGPQLNALMGRTMGSVEGFQYSKVFQDAMADGRVWDEEALAAFLAKPKSYMKGTKMSFAGLKKKGDQEAIAAYLSSFLGSDHATVAPAAPAFSVSADVLALEGDVEYGEYLASECTTCHQADGSADGIPSITGWDTADFVTAMHAYNKKHRENPVMQMITGRLANDEIAALAAYFKSLGN